MVVALAEPVLGVTAELASRVLLEEGDQTLPGRVDLGLDESCERLAEAV